MSFDIIGSAEVLPILCVRYFRWERERERDTERDGSDVTIVALKLAMNFTLSLAKNSHNWRIAYTFPCHKFALFVSPFTLPVSPFTERSPWWRWNSQWVHTFHCQKLFRPQALFPLFIIGSASYIVCEVLSVRERERDTERERERERERRKWRHHCRAKIDDEHTFTCQKFAQLAMSLHFPLPKIRFFRFSLHTSRLSLHGEVTIVALKFAMSSHFPLPKLFSPSLFPLFQMARAARRVIENPRQMIKSCPVLFCSSHRKTESN